VISITSDVAKATQQRRRFILCQLFSDQLLSLTTCIYTHLSIYSCLAKVKVTFIYIAPSHETSKMLRHGSQFYLQITPCLPFPCKCSPDGATTDLWQHSSNCSLQLIYRPPKDERLSWPSWLTYSRRFTHISGHPSAAGRAQDRESLPVKDRRSTTVSYNSIG